MLWLMQAKDWANLRRRLVWRLIDNHEYDKKDYR